MCQRGGGGGGGVGEGAQQVTFNMEVLAILKGGTHINNGHLKYKGGGGVLAYNFPIL